MKTILKFLVSIMVIFGSILPGFELISVNTSVKAAGEIFRVDKLVYKATSDTEVTVLRCNDTETGEINIPSSVTYTNGIKYNVTSINDDAFKFCENITAVTIPEGVTSIGAGSFTGCYSLARITIPNSVTYIGDGAFMYCKSLTNVDLPDGITTLECNIFNDCEKLESVKIPDSVTKLKIGVFSGCLSLKSIKLPDGVTDIGPYCFDYCKSLEGIVIPKKVKIIHEYTFFVCSELKRVILPNGITEIGSYAFRYCDKLNLLMPTYISHIHSDAFADCGNNVTIYARNYFGRNFAMGNNMKWVDVSSYLPELEETIDILSALEASYYSKSTYQVLQDALDNAKEAIANLNETDMRNATPLLLEAESQLFRIANYSEVDKAIDQAGKLDPNDYYDFSKVNEAIDAVVREKGIDEQTVVDEYAKAINDAIAGLELRPDSSKLTEAIKRASIYTSNNLSSDCKSQYESALANAKAVLNNFNATQEELDAATTALRNATNNVKSNMNFKDVPANAWYSGVVEEAFARGLMSAENEKKGLFSPDKNITRGMVATVLYRMAGTPNVTFSTKFPDVKAGLWYSNAIIWANQAGIVKGYNDGRFGVDDKITRQDLAIMLYNYATKVGKLKASETADLSKYKDVKSISPYALPSVEWAVANKLISGKENGTKVAPIDNATRAEAAKMFTMLQDLIIK